MEKFKQWMTAHKPQTVQTGSHKEDHGYYETESYVDYQYCSGCGTQK